MKLFLLCFVPLFVAVDALGVLPLYMGLTEGIARKRLDKIVLQSVITAMVTGILFIVAGQRALRLLGITVADFMIAGGALLFVFSVFDVISYERKHGQVDTESLGAVPIGVPLIVGPAVLTTAVLLVDLRGLVMTGIALIVNIIIAGIILWFSSPIYKLLGKAGAKTISKLAGLLLAAIGVMMIRKGVVLFIKMQGL
jgi:multiple antibiotic resistance protein